MAGREDRTISTHRRFVERQALEHEADEEGDKNALYREFLSGAYSAAGDVSQLAASLFDSESAQRYADRQKEAARIESSRSGLPQEFDDVNNLSDFAGYTGKILANSAPYMAGIAATGGVGSAVGGAALAARTGMALNTARATAGLGSAVAGSYPFEAGAILSDQRELTTRDGGQAVEDIPTALVAAIPSAALNVVGAEGALITKLGREKLKSGGLKARATRAGKEAMTTAAEEGFAEVGQQLTREIGKSAVDSEYSIVGDEAIKNYRESAIGGIIAGGAIGGAVGASQRVREKKAWTPPETRAEWTAPVAPEGTMDKEPKPYKSPEVKDMGSPDYKAPKVTSPELTEEPEVLKAVEEANAAVKQMTSKGSPFFVRPDDGALVTNTKRMSKSLAELSNSPPGRVQRDVFSQQLVKGLVEAIKEGPLNEETARKIADTLNFATEVYDSHVENGTLAPKTIAMYGRQLEAADKLATNYFDANRVISKPDEIRARLNEEAATENARLDELAADAAKAKAPLNIDTIAAGDVKKILAAAQHPNTSTAESVAETDIGRPLTRDEKRLLRDVQYNNKIDAELKKEQQKQQRAAQKQAKEQAEKDAILKRAADADAEQVKLLRKANKGVTDQKRRAEKKAEAEAATKAAADAKLKADISQASKDIAARATGPTPEVKAKIAQAAQAVAARAEKAEALRLERVAKLNEGVEAASQQANKLRDSYEKTPGKAKKEKLRADWMRAEKKVDRLLKQRNAFLKPEEIEALRNAEVVADEELDRRQDEPDAKLLRNRAKKARKKANVRAAKAEEEAMPAGLDEEGEVIPSEGAKFAKERDERLEAERAVGRITPSEPISVNQNMKAPPKTNPVKQAIAAGDTDLLKAMAELQAVRLKSTTQAKRKLIDRLMQEAAARPDGLDVIREVAPIIQKKGTKAGEKALNDIAAKQAPQPAPETTDKVAELEKTISEIRETVRLLQEAATAQAEADAETVTLYRGEGQTDPNRRTNAKGEWYTTDRARAEGYIDPDVDGNRGVFEVAIPAKDFRKLKRGIGPDEYLVPTTMLANKKLVAPETAPETTAKPEGDSLMEGIRDIQSLDQQREAPAVEAPAVKAPAATAEAILETYTLTELEAALKAYDASGTPQTGKDRSKLPKGVSFLSLLEEVIDRKERLEGSKGENEAKWAAEAEAERAFRSETRKNKEASFEAEKKAFAEAITKQVSKTNKKPPRRADNYDPARASGSREGEISVAEALGTIRMVTSDWKNLPEVQVFDSRKEMPEWLEVTFPEDERNMFTGSVSSKGFFTPEGPSGKPLIVVFSDRASSTTELVSTVYHEALGHYGLRAAFGKELRKMLDQMYDGNTAFRNAVDRRAKELGRDAENFGRIPESDQRAYAAEEVLARLSENAAYTGPATGPKFEGIIRRISNMVRRFARRMGWIKPTWTTEEILSVVNEGQRRTMAGSRLGNRDTSGASAASGAVPVQPTKTLDELAADNTWNEYIESQTTTLKNLAKKGVFGAMFSRDLVAAIKSNLKSAEGYFAAMIENEAAGQKLTDDVDKILQRAEKVDPAQRRQLSRFLKKQSIKEEWFFAPDWDSTATFDPSSAAAKEWQSLTPAQREVGEAMLRHAHTTRQQLLKEVRDAINAQIRRNADGREMTNAEWDALPDIQKRQRVNQAKSKLNLFNQKLGGVRGPYVPLMRFGDYVTVGKSKQYRAVAAEHKSATGDRRAELTEQLEALRADPAHYFVAFSDTLGTAKRMAANLAKEPEGQGLEFSAFEKRVAVQDFGNSPWIAMNKLKDAFEEEARAGKIDPAAVADVNNVLTSLYLQSLAETSARRSQQKRQNVTGADDNVLRAFAFKGRADAQFIASIKNNSKISRAMAEMSEEVKSAPPSEREAASRAFNEVLKRHRQQQVNTNWPIVDKALAVSSVFHLLTAPRYYIQNLTQTFMLTAPYLAARHGVKAYTEIFNAYPEIAKALNAQDRGAFLNGEFDFDRMPNSVTANQKEVLRRLKDRGLLDIGLNYEIGRWKSDLDREGQGVLGKLTTGISNKASNMFAALSNATRQVEVINRVTAALAADRLYKGPKGINEKAYMEYMEDVLATTQGDYSKLNAPRYMNELPRLVTQFRKYQFIQLSLLAKNFHTSVLDENATAEDRAVAKRVLMYTLSQTAAVTGLVGLPFVNMGMYAAEAMFGDDEEPADAERWMRQYIGNDDMADLILKGGFAAIGLDISANIGMGTSTALLPFSDGDLNSREGLEKLAYAAIGPIGGVASNVVDGFAYVREGRTARGVEQMMPSGIRAAWKALREQVYEGKSRRNGDIVMQPEEYDHADLFLGLLGIQSDRTQDVNRRTQMLYEYEKHYQAYTTKLRRQFVEATETRDAVAKREIIKNWQKLQASKQRNGWKFSPVSNLYKAKPEQVKRERDYRRRFDAAGSVINTGSL